MPGAQHFVRSAEGEPLAVLGFGAAAWKTAPKFIGWERRQRNLPFVVNNARLLPWVRIKHLASHVLAQVERCLLDDWDRRYALRPALLETFCESLAGTCYRAANWIRVGKTQGRGKLDVKNEYALPVKDIWLIPNPLFNNLFCGSCSSPVPVHNRRDFSWRITQPTFPTSVANLLDILEHTIREAILFQVLDNVLHSILDYKAAEAKELCSRGSQALYFCASQHRREPERSGFPVARKYWRDVRSWMLCWPAMWPTASILSAHAAPKR